MDATYLAGVRRALLEIDLYGCSENDAEEREERDDEESEAEHGDLVGVDEDEAECARCGKTGSCRSEL